MLTLSDYAQDEEQIHLVMDSLHAALLSECGDAMHALRTRPLNEMAASFFATDALVGDFTVLGAGHFAAAFRAPRLSGLVIKVGFKKEDSGAAYAAWCRGNADLQGVPAVFVIKAYPDCYMVCMPEYLPLPYDCWGYSLGKAVEDVLRGGDTTSAFAAYPILQPLAGTALAIREWFTGLATFDVHADNIMLDKFLNIVITDPVSFTQEE